ncbi:MAG: serine hydrolase domain-containing protein [Sphingomonadales bacterium]|jgi:CubicO group peptidase (beta-lactamase class C family)
MMLSNALLIERRQLLAGLAATAFASAGPARAAGKLAPLKTGALQGMIDRFVSAGKVSGAVVALVEPGAFKPQFVTAGVTAFGGSEKVTPDTQWRIYSMSKPITAMAVMQRIATGDLKLDQPVADILPELKNLRVLADPEKGLDSVPAESAMTIRQLLTHTAGLSYSIQPNGPLEKEYKRLGIQPGSVPGFLQPGEGPLPDLNGMVAALAGLPLWQQPGKAWRYSIGLDVAGALLERLTGQTFDQVLQQQLFGPLGMRDTGFWAKDASRLAANYIWTMPGGTKPMAKPLPLAPLEKDGFTSRPKLLSGGGGLVASTRDYARFTQMLLNEGDFNGATVMPRGTARLAMSNLMPVGTYFEGSNGFGAGGRVTLFDTRSTGWKGAAGSPAEVYGWGGAAGTLFAVDRVRQMGVVLMLQFMANPAFNQQAELANAIALDADQR